MGTIIGGFKHINLNALFDEPDRQQVVADTDAKAGDAVVWTEPGRVAKLEEPMKEETALVPAVPEVVEQQAELRLVALRPTDMEVAQRQLLSWAKGKIKFEQANYTELRENYEIAAKNRWRAGTVKRHMQMALKKVEYYKKLKAAVEAGYYIIPDFPIDIFAIRSAKHRPAAKEDTGKNYRPGIPDESAQNLPVGVGEYKNPSQIIESDGWSVTDKDGKEHNMYRVWADDWAPELDFPFTLAKPAVLKATQEAMALKIFDEVGVLPQTNKKDPMVIGRIIRPNLNPYGVTRISFLIAWFLDTHTL